MYTTMLHSKKIYQKSNCSNNISYMYHVLSPHGEFILVSKIGGGIMEKNLTFLSHIHLLIDYVWG